MKNTVSKALLRSSSRLILPFIFLFIVTGIVIAATSVDTTFTHTIGQGTLSISIVDSLGDPVTSPAVAFSSGVTFSFTAQDTTATLGTATEMIRITNATTTVPWNVSLAAKLGAGTLWTTGSYSHPFDSTSGADSGRLTVDPSVATITPMSGCSSTGFFLNGTTDSITLLTAGATADDLCMWDLTGISLSQRIPAQQEPGAYSLAMTISVM